MTDGLERLALKFNSQTPHTPFFEPLFRALQSTADVDSLNSGLRSFLTSDSVHNRSDDDKTLILATRCSDTMLLDSISRPVHLGNQIGRGGEGSVYEVEGEPSLVAKVYHKRPLPDDQVAKLQAMVPCWSSALETISAWPRSMLFDPLSRKPCGILMTQDGRRPAAARAVRHDEPPPAFSGGRLAPHGARRPQHGRRVSNAALGGHRRRRRQPGQSARRQGDVRADDRLRLVPDHHGRPHVSLPASARRTSRRRSCSRKSCATSFARRTTIGSAWRC